MNLLVTGATGALGRAVVRRALENEKTERVAAFARSESRLAELTNEFGHYPAFRPFLGDVRDERRLRDACVGIDTVIHGAALKRVDDGAYNPLEMHNTNVGGSINVANAARAEGVRNVLLVSSDKAVAATNTYGGSKYQAENCLRELNAHSVPRGTRMACVRYGNVLGSTGSVLTIWRRQQERGEPFRITDKGMTRFWLTMEQAVDHLFKALRVMRGGEVIVPVIQSSTVWLLAQAFQAAMGWDAADVEVIGSRPGGEKRHEMLINEDEQTRVVAQKGVLVVPPAVHSWTSDEWVTDGTVKVPNPYVSNSALCCTHTLGTLVNMLGDAT